MTCYLASHFAQVIIFKCLLPSFCIIAAVGGQQSCGSISYTPGPQVTCQPLDTCKGLACSNPIRKRNITFTVQNCTDPVLVNYTIVHSETGTLISTQLINDTFVMGNATHKMSWNISRNASHLFIQVVRSCIPSFSPPSLSPLSLSLPSLSPPLSPSPLSPPLSLSLTLVQTLTSAHAIHMAEFCLEHLTYVLRNAFLRHRVITLCYAILK